MFRAPHPCPRPSPSQAKDVLPESAASVLSSPREAHGRAVLEKAHCSQARMFKDFVAPVSVGAAVRSGVLGNMAGWWWSAWLVVPAPEVYVATAVRRAWCRRRSTNTHFPWWGFGLAAETGSGRVCKQVLCVFKATLGAPTGTEEESFVLWECERWLCWGVSCGSRPERARGWGPGALGTARTEVQAEGEGLDRDSRCLDPPPGEGVWSDGATKGSAAGY